MRHRPIPIGFIVLATASCLFSQIELGNIQMHGFISQGYMVTSHNEYLSMKTTKGSFEVNETAINFSTDITDRLRGGLQLLSRDLGKVGNNTVMLDWAFVDYRLRDYLGFRVGKIKTPLALYNEIRDVDALRTFILLPQSVYDENVRDFSFAFQGGAIYGNYQFGSLGDLDYNLYMGTFNIPDPNTGFWYDSFSNLSSAISPLLEQPSIPIQSVDICNADISAEYIWGGSAYWDTFLEGLKIGGCYLYGLINMNACMDIRSLKSLSGGESVLQNTTTPLDIGVKIKDYYTLSGEYVFNNLTLTGEYHSRIYKTDIKIPEMGTRLRQDYQLIGYYGQATYRFMEWFELGGYYSFYDDVDSHIKGLPSWLFTQTDMCGAIRFDITPNWLIKLEGHHIDGVALALPFENPEGRERYWNLFAIKSSFSF